MGVLICRSYPGACVCVERLIFIVKLKMDLLYICPKLRASTHPLAMVLTMDQTESKENELKTKNACWFCKYLFRSSTLVYLTVNWSCIINCTNECTSIDPLMAAKYVLQFVWFLMTFWGDAFDNDWNRVLQATHLTEC